MIQNLTNISKTIIISSLTLVIISLLFSPYEVNGRSMQPTLEDGDKVLVLRLNYINLPIIDQKIIINQPKKDSIIAFKKKNSETELIKRVIGLPNEEIDIKNRTVFINGIIQEQGIGVTNPNSDFPIMVDENCVFEQQFVVPKHGNHNFRLFENISYKISLNFCIFIAQSIFLGF